MPNILNSQSSHWTMNNGNGILIPPTHTHTQIEQQVKLNRHLFLQTVEKKNMINQ